MPGRTPFYDSRRGPNAFEYYFQPVCAGELAQQGPPMLTCEQREKVRAVQSLDLITEKHMMLTRGPSHGMPQIRIPQT